MHITVDFNNEFIIHYDIYAEDLYIVLSADTACVQNT